MRWHLLSAWKVCPSSVDAPYRQPPIPLGPLWTTPARLPPKWTDELRFQRLTDVNAAYDEVANAFWLQARKVGPSRGEHTASIIGMIESSKDREYRLRRGEQR